MTEPSLYEQGFRDALLTVNSLTNMTQDLDIVRRGLHQLIEEKNHDLWNLLAIARADLFDYPEAEALRTIMTAPSGVAIDVEGRVLFLRLQGTEYTTGVVELIRENTALRAEIHDRSNERIPQRINSVIINGQIIAMRRLTGLTHKYIASFEEIVAFAEVEGANTVTFRVKQDETGRPSQGTLAPGESTWLYEDMVFNVSKT